MSARQKEKILYGVAFVAILLFGFFQIQTKDEPEQGELVQTEENLGEEIQETSEVEQLSEAEVEAKPQAIYVHVAGAVAQPGLYRLYEGDRVQDALEKAGGVLETADLSDLNLSQKLMDEMKIRVLELKLEEEESLSEDPPTIELPENTPMVEKQTGSQAAGGKVNINLASKEELMTLPGVGEVRAQSIIDYRTEKPFDSIEEIQNISGIGPKSFEQLKDLIQVH